MKKLLSLILTAMLLTACGNRMPEGVPQDFAVYYADWINENQPEILDTYEGYIQKDLINNGTARVDYIPSDEEIVAIYNKITELELWTMPNNVRADADVILPMTYIEIRFTMDGKTYEILADSTIFHGANKVIDPDDEETIKEFCMFMKQFMMETDEYQSLPDSEGGYM